MGKTRLVVHGGLWEKDGQPLSGAEGKFTIQPSGELLVKNSEVRAWSRGSFAHL